MENKADPGGATRFGVSLRYALAQVKISPDLLPFFDVDHDTHVDRKDIEGLTADEAASIYFECWWKPGPYEALTPDLIAWKTFDIAVNAGPKRAALILQTALGHSGSPVATDGSIGPATIAAVSRQAKIDAGATLLTNMRLEQADFYRGLVAQEPKLKTFLKGWLNRAAD